MSDNPPRILIVSSRADAGAGGETYLLSVLRHLDRQRFDPVVLLPAEGDLMPRLRDMNIRFEIAGNQYNWLQPPEPWIRLLNGLQPVVDKLCGIIERHQIDIVHTNTNYRLEGALAARLSGTRHLYLAHIEFQPEMPIFQRFPLTQASFARLMGDLSAQTIAVSRSVADTLQPMIPSSRVKVVHNGIELEDFDGKATTPSSVRDELGLPAGAHLVVAVGRMNPDKGFDLFVEAAIEVLRNSDNTHFLLVGGGEIAEFEEQIRQRVKQSGIAPHFHFLGHRQDVPALLHQTDVFVLSSRREGHPYVMLEAMAASCPVVACDCAGVEETLNEGENGFIVPIGDVNGLATGIARLVGDSGLRGAMSRAARKTIEDRFQAKHTAAGLMDTYDEMLAATAPEPGAPAIDFFLQAVTEMGRMGERQVEMEARLQKAEQLSKLVFDNRVLGLLKSARKTLFRHGS